MRTRRFALRDHIFVEVVFAEGSDHGDVGDSTALPHRFQVFQIENGYDCALKIHSEPAREVRLPEENLILHHPATHHEHGDQH